VPASSFAAEWGGRAGEGSGRQPSALSVAVWGKYSKKEVWAKERKRSGFSLWSRTH
jgi:hypothetical protein